MRCHRPTFLRCLSLILLLFIQLLPISMFSQGIKTRVLKPWEQTASVIRGERIYKQACAACHGVNGNGNGPAAEALDPRPRDFTSGTYKFRSTPSGELPTDDDLYQIITNGIPRTMMPAWDKLLAEQERRDVVAYLKTFSGKFEKFAVRTPITIPPEPEVTAQSIAEGKGLYMIMECWVCHGVRGKGNGKSANDLVDEWGYKIKPFDFTIGNYKGGNDNRSVYKTFNTGLNGTPMPSYAEAFLFGGDSIGDLSSYREFYSESEVEALQAYLDSQPTEEEIEKMSEKEQEKLAARRAWSLVHFVKSLSKKKSLFYKLFVEKTDQTQ